MKNLKWHLILFPILAIAFSGYFLYKYYDEKGSTIEILFSEANSIQPEKTRLFYRGVPVGVVKEITLSEDGKNAVCVVELQKTAAQFAVEGSAFYLVSPKVSFEGISGLETLISGSYIAVDPGPKDAKKKDKFDGALSPPISKPEENTSKYILETDHAESISTGDNIFFRGLIIGQVGVVNLNKTSQRVLIEINIKNKFVKLIRTNTSFWKKQGVKVDLGLFKSDIRINSLDTIMKGGIEIGTPNNPGEIAKYGQTFPLLRDEPEDREDEKWDPSLTFPERKKSSRKKK